MFIGVTGNKICFILMHYSGKTGRDREGRRKTALGMAAVHHGKQ
ncbi:hypothetical protein [Telluribacter sp. SYSU D00476]